MSSKQKLIELFKTSDPDFDITKLHISNPFQIELNNEGHNTGVIIKPNDADSGYIGNKRYTYYRKDLRILFNQILPNFDFTNIQTHEQAIEAINSRFGLAIDPTEFEDYEPSVANGYFLTPKENNYEYTGSILFKHATALSKTKRLVLAGFNYPSSAIERIQASVYSRNLDTFLSYYLTNLNVGDTISTQLFARILNLITVDTWDYLSNPYAYNTYNAIVSGININEESSLMTIKIALDNTYSTKIAGELIFTVPIGSLVIPQSAKINFTGVAGLLDLPTWGQPSPEEVNLLNNTLSSRDVTQSVTSQWTIVYHGLVEECPDVYLPLVSLDTENICILINGYDTKQLPVIISYN